MNFLRLLCLGFTVVCAAQVNPILGDAGSYDPSNFPGCISLNQEAIEGDIPLDRLRYESIPGKETDDERLHKEFLAHALKKIKGEEDKKFRNQLQVTFAVYYRFDKKVYKQYASAIICKYEFGYKKNECRNRNFYFFSYLDPATIADVIVDNISMSKPIIRRCSWDTSP